MKNQQHPLYNWVPYKLLENDGQLIFEWIYLGDKKYTEPFFEETISKCRSLPYNSKRYKVLSSADLLIEWALQIEFADLKALIFHVSRCGSTMMSQLLTIPDRNIVLSEAPLIDQILRSEIIGPSEKDTLLKSVLKLLGQKRFAEQTDLIIKLDSWHIFQADWLRTSFPDLPFLILFRTPEEVLKSHAQLRGMHMVPHVIPHHTFGITAVEIQQLSFEQYGVKVQEQYLQAILAFVQKDSHVSVCDYKDGMLHALHTFNAMLKINYTEIETEKAQTRLGTHSKNPEQSFNGDKDITVRLDISRANELYEKLVSEIQKENARK